MQKIRTFFASVIRKTGRVHFIALLLTLILLCFLAGITFYLERQKESLPDQLMAKRWSAQGDYAQLSFFFSERLCLGTEQIQSTRYQMEKALKDAGEEPDNSLARLYVDTYASFGELTVQGEKKSVSVTAIGVGGDFFLFHPVKLLSGRYFAESDIRKDVVLIDENVAWQLFGSSDIEGKDVRINDAYYRIGGVYERPEGELEQMAGSDELTVYLPYESYTSVFPEAAITMYEAVLPNPVRGFAMKLTEPFFNFEDTDMAVVENSDRFSYEAFYQILKTRAVRSMKVNDIVLPFWENIARVKEEKLAEVALVQVCIVAALVLYWIVAIIVFMVKHKPTKEGIVTMVEYIQGWFSQRSTDKKGKVKKEETK